MSCGRIHYADDDPLEEHPSVVDPLGKDPPRGDPGTVVFTDEDLRRAARIAGCTAGGPHGHFFYHEFGSLDLVCRGCPARIKVAAYG